MRRLVAALLAVLAWVATASLQNVLTDLAGRGGTGGCPTFDVPAGGSTFFLDPLTAPAGVAVDPSGKLFVSTSSNCVWRLDADGLLRMGFLDSAPFRAGSGVAGFADGDATTALLNNPMKLALDSAGNLYVADAGNHRIRKVNLATWTITTVAGGGSLRPIDGINATDASFLFPTGVAVDPAGNLYVSDTNAAKVFKVDTSGVLTRFAGSGSFTYSGENIPATSSGMIPMGIASDASGDIFIADWSNSIIRKVTPDGNITTVAGTPFNSTFLGDGGPAVGAALNKPRGVAVDTNGNLFIADTDNQRIRMVDQNGIIATIAGNGSAGSADGQLNFPTAVAADNLGNVFIADTNNNKLRGIIVSPRTYALTLGAAGTGAGTLSGAGSYLVGQFIPVSAAASVGSTFAGWSGPNAAECASGSVLMDADKSCTATFTAAPDNTPPVLTGVPASIAVSTTSAAGTVVTYALPAASDPDDVAGPVSCTPPSGSNFAVGTTTVTCTSTDTHGNTGSASFTVTVTLVAPTISIAVNEPISVGDSGGDSGVTTPILLLVQEPISVGDSGGGSGVTTPVLLFVQEPISVGDSGGNSGVMTPVALLIQEPISVLDDSGSGGGVRAPLPILVQEAVSVGDGVTVPPAVTLVVQESVTLGDSDSAIVPDTTPPIVAVPASMTVDATSPAGTAVTFAATASDPDDAAGPVTCTPASGSTFPIGTTTVTCRSTDTHGNVGTAVFSVSVLTPSQMVGNLIAGTAAAGLAQTSKLLQNAAQSLARNNVSAACGQITASANQVAAQSGKTLTTAQAADLLRHTADVKATLGCR